MPTSNHIATKVVDFVLVDEEREALEPAPKLHLNKRIPLFLDVDVDSIELSPESCDKKRSRRSPTKLFYTNKQQRSRRGSPPNKKSKYYPNSNHYEIVNDRYKTEPCRSWEELGTCKYGDKCQFAHGPDELRNIDRHYKVYEKSVITHVVVV